MAVLDDILAGQQADQNQGLALAAHDASWANFFNSTPPDEKLRANLNLTNMVSDALQRKQDLLAQTDQNAANLRLTNAHFQEFQKQAPIREQLLQAQVDATGATERRRAAEATMEAQHTANLNQGLLGLYQAGMHKGSPEFQSGVADLMAKYPHADVKHIAELGKLAGVPDGVDPIQYAQEAKAAKDAALAAGLTNPSVRSYQGHPTVVEGQTVVPNDQKIADAVAREKALSGVRTEDAVARANALKDTKTNKPPAIDTYEKFNKELAAMISAHGGAAKVPQSEWARFEARKSAIASGGAASPAPTIVAPIVPDEVPSNAPSTAISPVVAPAVSAPVKITNPEDFHKLPSGAEFIDPKGVHRRKP